MRFLAFLILKKKINEAKTESKEEPLKIKIRDEAYLNAAKNNADINEILLKWGDKLVAASLQDTKTDAEILGEGVCFAKTIDVTQQLQKGTLDLSKLDEFSPKHRFVQANLLNFVRTKEEFIGRKKKITEEMLTVPNEILKTFDLENEKIQNFNKLKWKGKNESTYEYVKNNLNLLDSKIFNRGSGVVNITISLEGDDAHALCFQADEKNNKFNFYDSNFGFFDGFDSKDELFEFVSIYLGARYPEMTTIVFSQFQLKGAKLTEDVDSSKINRIKFDEVENKAPNPERDLASKKERTVATEVKLTGAPALIEDKVVKESTGDSLKKKSQPLQPKKEERPSEVKHQKETTDSSKKKKIKKPKALKAEVIETKEPGNPDPKIIQQVFTQQEIKTSEPVSPAPALQSYFQVPESSTKSLGLWDSFIAWIKSLFWSDKFSSENNEPKETQVISHDKTTLNGAAESQVNVKTRTYLPVQTGKGQKNFTGTRAFTSPNPSISEKNKKYKS